MKKSGLRAITIAIVVVLMTQTVWAADVTGYNRSSEEGIKQAYLQNTELTEEECMILGKQLSVETFLFLSEHEVKIDSSNQRMLLGIKNLCNNVPGLNGLNQSILSLKQEAEVYGFSNEQISKYIEGIVATEPTIIGPKDDFSDLMGSPDSEDGDTGVAGKFIDVSKSSYFYEPVGWAVDNEITSGIDDEHFAPNMVTTRAQMVTFLWRAAGSPTVKNVKNDFEDVSKDSYYYDAVMWAVKNGITTGVTETEFKPDDAVTRAQAVTFLWRNAGGPEAAGETAFKDVVSGSYYEQAVKWAVDNGITTGMLKDKFAPNDSCTRAQIVTFLYRNSSITKKV